MQQYIPQMCRAQTPPAFWQYGIHASKVQSTHKNNSYNEQASTSPQNAQPHGIIATDKTRVEQESTSVEKANVQKKKRNRREMRCAEFEASYTSLRKEEERNDITEELVRDFMSRKCRGWVNVL